MTGWSLACGPGLAEATELLSTSELSLVGRLPWSSNLTYLASLDDARGDPLYAVYKPGAGERSLWDFPDRLYRREMAAYALSEALDWKIVPPTVIRDDGPFGEGSLQLFVEVDYAEHYLTLLEERRYQSFFRTVCAFDIVANNADRKSGHVLQGSDGRLWGIDHGLCFHHQPKLRTVIWEFADEPVPEDLLADLEALGEDLPDSVGCLLSGPERSSLQRRARHLVETGVFPEPLGDWPPYPWPLV